MLSGRYITIEMLPFSFREYCEAVQGRSVRQNFNDWLRFGSFPYAVSLPRTDNAVTPYIEGVYNTILVKDVAKREGSLLRVSTRGHPECEQKALFKGITDIAVLESIAKFLADNIGSPVSAKKISDAINSGGRKISVNTVDRYLRALRDSYIFYKADRYDIKGRQYLKTLGKYYLVDTGIRNLLLSGSTAGIGHLIENVVYFELLRRGYRVNIGKVAEKEVDFVAENTDGIAYFQVSATVIEENTLRRELAPLEKIADNHPKTLLTLDEIGAGVNHKGIRQMNLLDWLLGVQR
jgi:predicted AAA+ superfamily ATPase